MSSAASAPLPFAIATRPRYAPCSVVPGMPYRVDSIQSKRAFRLRRRQLRGDSCSQHPIILIHDVVPRVALSDARRSEATHPLGAIRVDVQIIEELRHGLGVGE